MHKGLDWKKREIINEENKNKKYRINKYSGHLSPTYQIEENILNWFICNRKLGIRITTKAIIEYTITLIPEFKKNIWMNYINGVIVSWREINYLYDIHSYGTKISS